jgi:hypothetical protein
MWAIEASKQLEVDTANRRANGESDGSFHSTFAVAAFPSPTYAEFKKHQAKQRTLPPMLQPPFCG